MILRQLFCRLRENPAFALIYGMLMPEDCSITRSVHRSTGPCASDRVADVRPSFEEEKTMRTYTFHVSLPGHGQQFVWRKVELPADATLEGLHFAIQDAYAFDADHLYSFFMSGKAWDERAPSIRCPRMPLKIWMMTPQTKTMRSFYGSLRSTAQLTGGAGHADPGSVARDDADAPK